MEYGYNWHTGFWGDALNLQNKRDLGESLRNDFDLLYSQLLMYFWATVYTKNFRTKFLKLTMKSYAIKRSR